MQLAKAMQFMRENSLIHQDLKPENILLKKENNGEYAVRLADFGSILSCDYENPVKGQPFGSFYYTAPEKLLSKEFSANSDLFSAGCILYFMVAGHALYSEVKEWDTDSYIEKVKEANINIPNNNLSPSFWNILYRLLQPQSTERLSFPDFFDHSFIS